MWNSGLGEMFRPGFRVLWHDVSWRVGIFLSCLDIAPISECNIWDSLTWGHLTRVLGGPQSPGLPRRPIVCSVSPLNARYHHHLPTRVAMTCVRTHVASVWINPQVFSDICEARKAEGSKIIGLYQNMLWYKHLLCQIKSLLVAKGYYIVKC